MSLESRIKHLESLLHAALTIANMAYDEGFCDGRGMDVDETGTTPEQYRAYYERIESRIREALGD